MELDNFQPGIPIPEMAAGINQATVKTVRDEAQTKKAEQTTTQEKVATEPILQTTPSPKTTLLTRLANFFHLPLKPKVDSLKPPPTK